MFGPSRERILRELAPGALVLDVGGGGQPFERADYVVDLLPYEERGIYDYEPAPARERFSAETWVQLDVCGHDPWPFPDDHFDFVVCSHTLEDVRDPIRTCQEISRVGRAGYVEVPSRLEEQSYGFQGPWTGWGHHRWLIDLDDGELVFVFKHHVLHNREQDHFAERLQPALPEELRVQCVFWEGTLPARERIFLDGDSLDAYLADYVAAHRDIEARYLPPPPPPPPPPPWPQRIARRLRRGP